MWAVWYTEAAALLVNLSSSLPGPPQLLTSGNRLRLKNLRQSPTTSQSTRSSSINVAPVNQTIILGLQIFLDHRSLSSIDPKILITLESYSSSFRTLIFLPFCLFVFQSFIVFLSLLFTVKHRGTMPPQDGAYDIMIKTKYPCKFNYLHAYSCSNHLFISLMLFHAVGANICCKAYSKQIPFQDMSCLARARVHYNNALHIYMQYYHFKSHHWSR